MSTLDRLFDMAGGVDGDHISGVGDQISHFEMPASATSSVADAGLGALG